ELGEVLEDVVPDVELGFPAGAEDQAPDGHHGAGCSQGDQQQQPDLVEEAGHVEDAGSQPVDHSSRYERGEGGEVAVEDDEHEPDAEPQTVLPQVPREVAYGEIGRAHV